MTSNMTKAKHKNYAHFYIFFGQLLSYGTPTSKHDNERSRHLELHSKVGIWLSAHNKLELTTTIADNVRFSFVDLSSVFHSSEIFNVDLPSERQEIKENKWHVKHVWIIHNAKWSNWSNILSATIFRYDKLYSDLELGITLIT